MGKAKKLTGVPWHVEPAKDVYERKRRTWCGYYDQETGKCKLFCELCHTNTACSHYWVYKKPNNDDIDKTNICKPFNGVQEIDMEDIMINEKKEKPSKKDYDGILQYYKDHEYNFQHPISVVCKDGKYLLKEFYKIYYVARDIGLKKIKAQIYCGIPYSIIKKFKKIGNSFNHKDYGRGTIVEVKNNNITVRFDSGKQIKFNVIAYLKSKINEKE